MTRKGSIKETGEEISDAKWQRFEAAVGVDKDRKESGIQTDQPYREEVEHRRKSGDDPKTDDTNDADREHDAGKTTERTE